MRTTAFRSFPGNGVAASGGVGLLATVPTLIGPFSVITTDPGDDPDGAAAVLASGWTDDPAALLWQVAKSMLPGHLRSVRSVPGVTDAAIAYHDGDLTAIDAVPVRQRSAAFRCHAWDVLRTVRPGSPVSYSEYAALAGRPAAVRAAAGACASNAAALFVPCHRVLRSDGALGGFRWGLPVKKWLLSHELAGCP